MQHNKFQTSEASEPVEADILMYIITEFYTCK